MVADPVGQALGPGGVGVVGSPQYRDEDLGGTVIAGVPIDNRYRLAGIVDKQLLPGMVGGWSGVSPRRASRLRRRSARNTRLLPQPAGGGPVSPHNSLKVTPVRRSSSCGPRPSPAAPAWRPVRRPSLRKRG